MYAQLTWTPDDSQPEALIVELPPQRIAEMQQLIGTEEWTRSEAVLWIPTRNRDGRFEQRLYRLARITAIEEQPHG